MSLIVKKRGRPSKADLAARALRAAPKPRNDAEVLNDLKARFNMLDRLTHAAMGANIRSLVVTGAPGVGKTYTVETILENESTTHEIVRGTLSAVNLYKLGYRNRRSGSVIVLDDADSIFTDEDALNQLKALCDSSATRRISWLKESQALKEDDIPTTYEFNGAFVFISNLDFQKYVDEGKNKFAVHFEALMSRSLYLDLRLHDRQAISLWVRHICTAGKLFERENVKPEIGARIIAFLVKYRDDLREFSLRTVLKAIQIAKSNPTAWESDARVLLLRS